MYGLFIFIYLFFFYVYKKVGTLSYDATVKIMKIVIKTWGFVLSVTERYPACYIFSVVSSMTITLLILFLEITKLFTIYYFSNILNYYEVEYITSPPNLYYCVYVYNKTYILSIH